MAEVTLETRLREALEAGASGAAPDANLAAAARERAQVRRRRRSGGAGLAVVLAAGMGLTAVLVEDGAPIDAPPVAVDDATTSQERGVPVGWHAVRWRGVEVQVPNTWDVGALSEWCRRGPLLSTPVVERPGDVGDSGCSDPKLGYGVQFLDHQESERVQSHEVRRPRPPEASIYPKDAWIGVTCGGCEVAIRVVALDRYAARYLLGSYEHSSELPGG